MTLGAVALLAGLVKKGVQTNLTSSANMSSAGPYSLWEVLTWAGVGAVSGLVAYLAPNAFGLHQATVAAPFFICATVIGFLLGSQYVRTSFSPLPCLLNFFSKESSLYCISAEVIPFSAFLSSVLLKSLFVYCLRTRKKGCIINRSFLLLFLCAGCPSLSRRSYTLLSPQLSS